MVCLSLSEMLSQTPGIDGTVWHGKVYTKVLMTEHNGLCYAGDILQMLNASSRRELLLRKRHMHVLY